MAQIKPSVHDGLEHLRQQIDTALEEMIAARIDSGEVVELSGRVLLAKATQTNNDVLIIRDSRRSRLVKNYAISNGL